MIKTAALALAAAMTLAGAASASEVRVLDPNAPVVHILLAGKSADQVKSEIFSAAKQVCAGDEVCVIDTVADATVQYRRLSSRHNAKLSVLRDGQSTIRIALERKSPTAIDAEIRKAAQTVCAAVNTDSSDDMNACVSQAVGDAHRQLRGMVVAAN
jgi:hypothetical protein